MLPTALLATRICAEDIGTYFNRYYLNLYMLPSPMRSRMYGSDCVARMLGHYLAEFTLDVYTNVTKDMQGEAAEKIGSFMAQVV